MFVGLNTFAQRPNLPQNETRRELRDLKFAGPNYYKPLQGRIIIIRGHYYQPLNARVIIQRSPRYRANNSTTCKKCIRQHRKHGILRQSHRPLHQSAQRRNSR